MEMKQVNTSYNGRTKTLTMRADSKEVLPAYMYYQLEFLGVPPDTIIQFNDRKVKIIDKEYVNVD